MKHTSPLKQLMELASNRFRSVPVKPGVYAVFWIRGGKPVSIHRILGVDNKGVLYIGSASRSKKGAKNRKWLRGRVKALWISIEKACSRRERKCYPHTFGPSLVYTGLNNVIRDEELWIYFKEFSADEARYQEKRAILEYTKRYGEPPPLNLQVGRRYFMMPNLGELGRSRLVGKLDLDLQTVLGLQP